MNFFALILAQSEGRGIGDKDVLRNRLITFSAYAAVILVAIIWVKFIRKQKREHRRVHVKKPHRWELVNDETPQRRHRHRHRQTPKLPTNPTRAQAGGIPPRREEELPLDA